MIRHIVKIAANAAFCLTIYLPYVTITSANKPLTYRKELAKMAKTMRYNAEMKLRDTKYYAIKRSDWMKFIERLYKFGRKDPIEEAHLIKDKHEITCWRAYYMAKNHGRNENGLFSLPWEWRQFVLEEIAKEV